MRIFNRSKLSAFLCVVALTWTSALVQATSKDHLVWSSDDGTQEIQVLLLMDTNDRGLVQMILFTLPNNERFILYSTVDSSSGIAWSRLEHDSSRWWFESGYDMHGQFESLQAYFDHIFEFNPPAADVEKYVTYSLKAESFLYEQTYDYAPRQGGRIEKEFSDSALDEENVINLVRSFPPSIRESLFYLSRFDRQVKFQYQTFIDFLVRLLHRAGFESDLEQEEFVFERVGYEWGLGTMITPEELEFTSRFKSIDNADPLAGWRPEDLFPEK